MGNSESIIDKSWLNRLMVSPPAVPPKKDMGALEKRELAGQISNNIDT